MEDPNAKGFAMQIGGNVKLSQHIAPANVTSAGAVSSTGLARGAYDRCCAIVSLGAIGASAALDVQLQECDTVGGTYTDISGAAITQLGASDDNKSCLIDAPVKKAYVKATATVTGTNGVLFGINLLLYSGRDRTPPTNSPADVVV